MLKIGIVGLGVISATHIDAIKKLSNIAVITAVCDCDIRKKEKVTGVAFYTNLEEMLDKEILDCLHICLPHYLHVWAASLAARHCVHVFMEKPAGLNCQEIECLETTSGIENIKLGVCLQNRYNITTKRIIELIKNHTYGRVQGCKAIVAWDRTKDYYTKDPWRGKKKEAGGGIMLSQAIHTLDLMRLFCGEIQWVKGLTGNLLLEDIEVEDTACAYIQFQDNIRGIFYGTVTHCDNSSVEIELVMEQGSLILKNNRLIYLLNHREELLAEDTIMEGGKDYYGYSHFFAVQDFYKHLLGRGGSFISLEEGKKTERLIEIINLSSELGKRIYWENDTYQ